MRGSSGGHRAGDVDWYYYCRDRSQGVTGKWLRSQEKNAIRAESDRLPVRDSGRP